MAFKAIPKNYTNHATEEPIRPYDEPTPMPAPLPDPCPHCKQQGRVYAFQEKYDDFDSFRKIKVTRWQAVLGCLFCWRVWPGTPETLEHRRKVAAK